MTQEDYIKTHPEQFKDNIDKWLFLEFGIIGGCCSAEKSHEYHIARMVAEKLNDAFIEKACRWLKESIEHAYYRSDLYLVNGRFINDFKKEMEEQL